VIFVSRIIHVKIDRRLNVTNKFIYQRRLSSRLAIAMFRGTPCNYEFFYKEQIYHQIKSNHAFREVLLSESNIQY